MIDVLPPTNAPTIPPKISEPEPTDSDISNGIVAASGGGNISEISGSEPTDANISEGIEAASGSGNTSITSCASCWNWWDISPQSLRGRGSSTLRLFCIVLNLHYLFRQSMPFAIAIHLQRSFNINLCLRRRNLADLCV